MASDESMRSGGKPPRRFAASSPLKNSPLPLGEGQGEGRLRVFPANRPPPPPPPQGGGGAGTPFSPAASGARAPPRTLWNRGGRKNRRASRWGRRLARGRRVCFSPRASPRGGG